MDYEKLSKYQRYRLRKSGVDVPKLKAGAPRGYKQSDEHVEKRKRFGSNHHAWLGDNVSVRGGRTRALRGFELEDCEKCGKGKAERHHLDDNTANNSKENIMFLCRKCHMEIDGRLEKFREMASRKH